MGLDMYAVRRFDFPLDAQPVGERYSVQIADGRERSLGIEIVSIAGTDEDVMQWRKANHIHAWFVDNVQNGVDDQRDYFVSWDQLRNLLSVCNQVIEASELVEGMTYAGTTYDQDHPNGIDNREPGKLIKDATVAAQLLPTRSGFFFGCTEYDEDYLDDVIETRDWIERMLADHENGVPGNIHYSCWW